MFWMVFFKLFFWKCNWWFLGYNNISECQKHLITKILFFVFKFWFKTNNLFTMSTVIPPISDVTPIHACAINDVTLLLVWAKATVVWAVLSVSSFIAFYKNQGILIINEMFQLIFMNKEHTHNNIGLS